MTNVQSAPTVKEAMMMNDAIKIIMICRTYYYNLLVVFNLYSMLI